VLPEERNVGVHTRSGKRRLVAIVVVVMSVVASVAGAPAAAALPGQENPSAGDGESAAAERGLLDIDVDVASDDAATVAEALGEVNTNVGDQLAELRSAQDAVTAALETLAARDAAVADTQMRIEELTAESDQVVIDAFVSPPADAALDAMLSESTVDATVKQTLVDLQADADAAVLEDLDQARDDLEEQQEDQEAAAEEADQARADAEAALAQLEGAVSQQTQFVLDVQARLEAGPSPGDPQAAGDVAALAGALGEIEAAQDLAEAQAELAQAQQEAVARGDIVCPVDGGGLNFIDSWGFSRSGGRAHEGTDMMAASGTPTPAPTNGEVVHRENSLGGLTWYVYGTNGHTYYGAHLASYENVGVGYVDAGTVIGYVGASGNASGGAPHLHFEYHPGGGGPVNPYSILDRACPDH
jgi:murein DD-endopeptidase MepM/ murein hydrolase activator NlpD